jgi:hypothetical protein
MTILPKTEDRAVVVFHVLPSLAYGARMAVAFGLIAVGFVVQLAMMAVLPGVFLIAAGNLLLLVRGYDNRVDFATFDPTAEWERVELGRLDDLVELHRQMRRWDVSALDVTNILGAALFVLITISTTAVAIFARGPLQILVIDAMVLLLPHWLTGVRSILVQPKLMVRVNTFRDVLEESAVKLADHEVNLLMLLSGSTTKIPDDVKIKVDITDRHPDFLGLYGQVVLNEVQGRSYPYFYAVLVTRRGFGLDEAIADYSPPSNVTVEHNIQDKVEVLVIRQTTTRKSGYHTEIEDAVRILHDAVEVAEKAATSRSNGPGGDHSPESKDDGRSADLRPSG